MAIYGWTGKILRVNLTTGAITHADTMRYVPKFVGGLGMAAKIAWDELKPGTGAFDPENLLMITVGPLTGTLASGAGRVEVTGIAPQQHPAVFSRSNIGGHWGAELKYAGFDGIIVEGRAEAPVTLWIHDGEAEIVEASDLWGQGTFATTARLRGLYGRQTRILSIGQAGENLSRIAVIQSETGQAAGQGGFGAVMGSKKLKAIAVRGTGGVRIAHPQRFKEICLSASREAESPNTSGPEGRFAKEPHYGPNYRWRKCGFCMTPCYHKFYMGVPGATDARSYTAAMQCGGVHSTSLSGSVQGRALCSDYGVNTWEIAFGIIPWLQRCKQQGLIQDVDGYAIPAPDRPIQYLDDVATVSPEFLEHLIRIITFREGEMGEALADGGCYAAERLFGGAGQPLLDDIYPRRCGQTEHWAGHWGPGGICYWPWWLPPLLQWCMDTRDPASDSSHQWTEHAQEFMLEWGPNKGHLPAEKAQRVCARVYGRADICDPAVTYDPPEARAIPALWHSHRGMIVGSLILCDYENTRVFSMLTEDGQADTALMSRLFSAATGGETSEQELDRAGERIWNLLRAIDVRNHGRDRRVDEATLDGFTYPCLASGVMLDRARFLTLMDSYYELSGWSKANGRPTRARLEQLDLKEVADELEAMGRLG